MKCCKNLNKSAMKGKNNISTNLLFDIRLQKKTKSNSWVFEKKTKSNSEYYII